jgi:hypothetical protein
MIRYLLLVLVLASAAVSAQIYRTTDEQGNVIFTDRPPAEQGTEVEAVELNRTNTTPPPAERPDLAPAAKPDKAAVTPNYAVSITAPADDTVIPMGPGNFSVAAATSPALAEGETLQLILSGTPWQEPQTRGQWNLTNIRRGEHDIVVLRLDPKGKELAASEPVRILVLRPTRAPN